LQADARWIIQRVVAALWPMSMLLFARLFFHRFDPARLRAAGALARRSWIGRFNAMAKPLARLFVKLAQVLIPVSGKPSLMRAAATDALTTIGAFPLLIVAMIAVGIAAMTASSQAIFTGVLPIAFAACALAIADVACREKRAATMALIFAAPSLRTRFVLWKFLSTLFIAVAVVGLPVGRAMAARPSSAVALLVGVMFLCATATALGIVSANPKTFIVLFLTFWYVTTQDKGASPALDFAGWFGTATPLVIAAYALIGVGFLTIAQLAHARELRRNY